MKRLDVWWWRSLRVRSFAVTFVVAGLALALYSRHYTLGQLAAIVLPAAAVVGWWLGWRLVRPIERLRDQALAQTRTLTPGADLELVRADEFGELTGALNHLLAELRDRAKEKEAFVADLAHEFKNPVAAIRAAAEALDSGTPDPVRQARLAGILGDSSRRLDTLVTQFLELARAEAGLDTEARTRVQLAVLVEARVRAFAADERFARLRFTHTTAPVIVDGVEARLQTIIDNLLENAASFATTTVAVELGAVAQGTMLVVHDDGPGIAAEDRERVFDRYFTRRASGRGTGLGLAMVRALVLAHGGTIEARARDGGGTSMVAHLPSLPA